VSGSEAATAIQDLAGSATFGFVKEQVSHFAENSKLLVGLLDEAGKVHPFIQRMSLPPSLFLLLSSADMYCVVAVSAFKSAVALEVARRGNDQKLTTLHVTMCDMMQVMTLSVKSFLPSRCAHPPGSLKSIATSNQGAGGLTIEQRLQSRILGITDSIKNCSKVCYSYEHRHTASKCSFLWSSKGAKALGTVKYFTSLKWKIRLGDVADQFEVHKKELLANLQFHTSITVTKTYDLLKSEMSSMKSMIYLAFERMQTPDERELAEFAQKNGGAERILENGTLVKQFLDMEKKVSAKDDKGSTFGKEGALIRTRSGLTPAELKSEIRKEVDTVLTEDTGAFERKLRDIEVYLKEVNVTIQRQSDRVISEVLAGMHTGPHERIKDKVRSPGF
jgi:hypothetical protein